MYQQIKEYISEHRQESYELLLTLAQIPAPSHKEQQRVAFIKDWLTQQGAEEVLMDEALNVILPIRAEEEGTYCIFCAHTDVVFNDEAPLPLKVEDGKIFCPGVGDDTANLVALLMVAKYLLEKGIKPCKGTLLLVANSCEEGLGNLKGSRQLIQTYGDKLDAFISFDGQIGSVVTRAVGSKRYRVEIRTEGGHSYGAFGNRNAIQYMASLIDSLYTMKVPTRGKTTYNVGTIHGGSTVNSIAEQCEILFEFRSDDVEDMEDMEKQFMAALNYYAAKGIELNWELVGERPCMGKELDEDAHNALVNRTEELSRALYGTDLRHRSGSTDCNIPLSKGIPSVCVGCYKGAKAHTRLEHVEIDSLPVGMELAFAMVLDRILTA